MFLDWFRANQNSSEGKELTYVEFPNKFVYLAKTNCGNQGSKGIPLVDLHIS